MRLIVVTLFLIGVSNFYAQVRLCSWNLHDFGSAKSDSEMVFIANTLKDFDVVAILEVVAGQGGAQAVARLSDQLNRSGAKWDYVVSDPTSGNSYKSERYAFLWKTSRLRKTGEPWLEKKYNLEIDREPFYLSLIYNGKEFTVSAFHAITKKMQPETEIKYFKFLNSEYPGKTILFCGDFNCPQSHTVFKPLRSMGYLPALIGQKTSLKQSDKVNNCLASEYDNIFYPSQKVSFHNAGVIEFYKSFLLFRKARDISDHLPVYFQFELK